MSLIVLLFNGILMLLFPLSLEILTPKLEYRNGSTGESLLGTLGIGEGERSITA